MDAMGCLDHKGSRKNRVYVPEVTVVQQAENLFDSTLSYVHLHVAKQTYKRKRTPLRVMVSGALLLKRYCSNNQVASATCYDEGVGYVYVWRWSSNLTAARPTASKNTYATGHGEKQVRQQ